VEVVRALNLPDQQVRETMVLLCEHGLVRATLSGFRITRRGWERLEMMMNASWR
jgi:hypothetical protein